LGTPESLGTYTIPVTVTDSSDPQQVVNADIHITVKPAAAGHPLLDVRDVVSAGYGSYCALLTTSGVDCWGDSSSGALGNGSFQASLVPVRVLNPTGRADLAGVTSLTGGTGGYCARLSTGRVDCWGYGYQGELGNGKFYTTGAQGSAVPVSVVGLGGKGALENVSALVSGKSEDGYCARLTTGRVDCWGFGLNGELGNGRYYTAGEQGSAVPVSVSGLGDKGTLTGVASISTSAGGYCAVLDSGRADCWGWGSSGRLGNGSLSNSAVPVAVKGLGGIGNLTRVASLSNSAGDSSCAILTNSRVDCWGDGSVGQLGNGTFGVSEVPVSVLGLGGKGVLGGVMSLSSDGGGYCAVLASGRVDCWGGGYSGELGNGTFYTSAQVGSSVPVAVSGLHGTGSLVGARKISTDGTGYCALLTSNRVDCWGYGPDGELGNGSFYVTGNQGSAVPVAVVGLSDTGALADVTDLSGGYTADIGWGSTCARLASGRVDCWGYNGYTGSLGSGFTGDSAYPVTVQRAT
jgi:alpha-tubulin suppressor-like RCC1 family protein